MAQHDVIDTPYGPPDSKENDSYHSAEEEEKKNANCAINNGNNYNHPQYGNGNSANNYNAQQPNVPSPPHAEIKDQEQRPRLIYHFLCRIHQ